MKFSKLAALAVVAGAGLALAGTPVFAQSASSGNAAWTASDSSVGAGSSGSLEAAGSSTSNSLSASKGGAGGGAIATPLGTGVFGFSTPGGTTNDDTTNNDTTTAAPTANNYNGTTTIVPGGGTSNNDTSNNDSTTQNGAQVTDAFNHTHVWFDAEHHQGAGARSKGESGAKGDAVSGVFIFGQNTVVGIDGTLEDNSVNGATATIQSGVLNNSSGALALNNVAGVGNQAGNVLQTALEMTGANSTIAGANSFQVAINQNLIDEGDINSNATQQNSATVQTNSLQGVTGSLAVNNVAGVANNAINSVTLLH
jgi:hypothetical protein